MIEAQSSQSINVSPRVNQEYGYANGTDDAGLTPWRCQKLPTAEQ
jgi:hypothetical protein